MMGIREKSVIEKGTENIIKTVDVIVPCYNEGDAPVRFFEESSGIFGGVEGYAFRYIFIDDGSTDDTLDSIKDAVKLAREKGGGFSAAFISFSRNFGKEAAMYAGLRASRGDLAVIMDVDLQHPPELVPEMIERMEETGCDSCAARRVSRKGEPCIRSFLARTFYRIMNRYSDIEIVDGAVDFRLMTKRMVRAVLTLPETQRFSKGIFSWVGFRTEWIEFENVRRISGESKWSLWGLVKYAAGGFFDFAAAPLKFTGVFGGAAAVCAAVYMVVEVVKTVIFGKDTPGYASTICLILFFGGLITAMLSVMGEYMGRMYMETKARPLYIEKESDIEGKDADGED